MTPTEKSPVKATPSPKVTPAGIASKEEKKPAEEEAGEEEDDDDDEVEGEGEEEEEGVGKKDTSEGTDWSKPIVYNHHKILTSPDWCNGECIRVVFVREVVCEMENPAESGTNLVPFAIIKDVAHIAEVTNYRALVNKQHQEYKRKFAIDGVVVVGIPVVKVGEVLEKSKVAKNVEEIERVCYVEEYIERTDTNWEQFDKKRKSVASNGTDAASPKKRKRSNSADSHQKKKNKKKNKDKSKKDKKTKKRAASQKHSKKRSSYSKKRRTDGSDIPRLMDAAKIALDYAPKEDQDQLADALITFCADNLLV